MTDPLWAMAAGCVPDVEPWEIPRIARQGGFDACGMWVDPNATWDASALHKTRQAIDDTGVQLVDVEAGWLDAGDTATDDHKVLIEAGLELGARNVLMVCRNAERSEAIAQFNAVCELAGDAIRVCLEFGEFTEVKSLEDASGFISHVPHPAAGILVDLMHLNRSGDALPDLSERLFPYVQACDFWQSSVAKTGMDYIVAAVDERCCLGEGEAPLENITRVCEADIDVSLEIRSKDLREQFTDPVERARQILARCERRAY